MGHVEQMFNCRDARAPRADTLGKPYEAMCGNAQPVGVLLL